MKKTLINVAIIFIFIFIYLLHANFFIEFKIAGVMPNMFVILMLFIGLFMGKRLGVVLSISLGILLDIFIGRRLGITSLMLSVVVIIGSVFDKNFSKDNRLTIMLMVGVSTIIYETGAYILNYIILETNLEWLLFVKVLLIEAIYNVILTIILYPIMQIAGYEIEEEYKGNKILTRYF